MTVRDTGIPQDQLWPHLATAWLEAPWRHNPASDAVPKTELSDQRADPSKPAWPRVFPGL